MNTVTCNYCDWEGTEEDLALIEFDANDPSETPTAIETTGGSSRRISPQPENVDFMKGCPNCETDGYLADINQDQDDE